MYARVGRMILPADRGRCSLCAFVAVALALVVFVLLRSGSVRRSEVREASPPAGTGDTEYWSGFDRRVLYFVKTCQAYSDRDAQFYAAWGKRAPNVVYASDLPLRRNSIPAALQRTYLLPDNAMTKAYLPAAEVHKAKSCATSMMVLGKVLSEKKWEHIAWLVVVDDDTFVMRRNLETYLWRFDPQKPQYLGFAFGEPAQDAQQAGRAYKTASSSAGFAFSRSLLNRMRADVREKFSLSAVYKQCRNAQMMDDFAMGRLAALQYDTELYDRPGVFADWHRLGADHFPSALTVHLQLRSGASNRNVMDKLIALARDQ